MRHARSARAPALVAFVLLCAGCREGLAFRDDGRLQITDPDDRTEVVVPFELVWSGRDLPAGTRFAVLVDQTPPPAGEALSWFARNDAGCRRDPRCPDDEYLRVRHVYVTDSSPLTVASVPRSSRPGERELRDVTVILLDSEDRRLGETSASVTVEVIRDR